MTKLHAALGIASVACIAACSRRVAPPTETRELDRETLPMPPARASTPPPPAVKEADGWDVSCEKDDDCVPVSPSGCCPSPCTATVVNKRDQARVSEALSEQCKQEERGPCPSAGACRGHAYLCVRNKCGLVFEGEPDYRKRQP